MPFTPRAKNNLHAWRVYARKGVMNELLTTKQAAERLSLSHERVTLLCRSEVLKAERVGGIYLIRASDLEAFAALDRKPGRPKKASAS